MRPLHVLGLVWVVAFASCERSPKPVEYDAGVLFSYPETFGEPFYHNPENEWTEERFDLGRKLFFDPILSADSSLSCAGCHHPEAGFSHPGVAVSPGIARTTLGTRNSPALSNLAWSPNFMHDGGVIHLEVMPFAPIISAHEMNADLGERIAVMQGRADFREAFRKAYGSDSITSQLVFYALAVYHSGLISANSPYDQAERGLHTLSSEEAAGKLLFETHCASCHPAPLFTDYGFANVGLDSISADPGRFLVTQNPADSGAFRVPSLRNVALSFPYMHDGRMQTLEEVVAFYSEGMLDLPNRDERLPENLHLSASEQAQLVAFLHTLTDVSYTTNERFQAP